MEQMSSKTNLEYIRLSDHFKKKDNRGKITRDSLLLFKLEDIKQIKKEEKIKIVKHRSKRVWGKPPKRHKALVDTRHITAETKATSVLSIAGPDQTIDDLNSEIKLCPSPRVKDGDESSDFFDDSMDGDMEFEDDKKTCLNSAIGQIPVSASLKRERQNQGSHAKSFVSTSSIQFTDHNGESPADDYELVDNEDEQHQ